MFATQVAKALLRSRGRPRTGTLLATPKPAHQHYLLSSTLLGEKSIDGKPTSNPEKGAGSLKTRKHNPCLYRELYAIDRNNFLGFNDPPLERKGSYSYYILRFAQ